MKQDIDIFEYAREIMKALKTGVLLTTKANNKVNVMTISWGTLGIEWGKPIFTLFIRENRFTRSQLDQHPEFTINIPRGEFDKKIPGFCGTKTGRSVDKIKELNLHLEEGRFVSVPAIREFPLTLECKIIYTQKQDKQEILKKNLMEFYPQDVDSSFYGANKDLHVAYYGEIVSAYILQ